MRKRMGETGLTMIEVAVVSVLMTVAISGAYSLFLTGTESAGQEMTRAELQAHAHRVVDQLADELISGGRDVIYPKPVPPYASPILTYQSSEGFDDGKQRWGPITSIEFEYDPGEVNDGRDNNGNGLIDEGMVVLTRNPGESDETRVVLSRWVREYLQGEVLNGKDDNGNGLIDEHGLCFDLEGTIWTVRLTLERLDSNKRTIRQTVETSIRIRN